MSNMLQINLGRGKICTEETIKFGECMNIDIILMQEPYVRDGRLSAQRIRQFYKAEEGMVWAAVAVLNEKYQAMLIEERSSCDVAVVKVRTDKGSEFTVVSAYCKADVSIQAYLMKWSCETATQEIQYSEWMLTRSQRFGTAREQTKEVMT